MMRAPLLMASLLLLGQGVSVAQEPLGKLFFSPERRVAMERQRQLNIQETQTLQGATVSLDGVIRRSTGDRTLWINGRPQHNDAGNAGVQAVIAPNDPSRAAIAADGDVPANLKVGESINRATREKHDGLGGGTLVVGKPARRN
jgi:hypothetical protein